LDREIKTRKQAFGIDIYDLMEALEEDKNLSVSDKETKIRAMFDAARKDIAVIQAKKECKTEEMSVLDAENGEGGASNIPPSSGTISNSLPAAGH
jgi:(p)ppGpp synthase/HD superfamily hydrolase